VFTFKDDSIQELQQFMQSSWGLLGCDTTTTNITAVNTVHFNVILPPTPRSSQWSLAFGPSNQNPVQQQHLFVVVIYAYGYAQTNLMLLIFPNL